MPLSPSSEHKRCHCRITPHNSSPAGQQTPSLQDRRRVDREVPFYPVPTLPGFPFQFPHNHERPITDPIRPDGSTSPQSEPYTPHDKGGHRGHSIIHARAWILLVPCFFFFLFSFLHLQKEKAVVLEYTAPHRTDYTYMAPCVVPRILCSLERVSVCRSVQVGTRHNYGMDTRGSRVIVAWPLASG